MTSGIADSLLAYLDKQREHMDEMQNAILVSQLQINMILRGAPDTVKKDIVEQSERLLKELREVDADHRKDRAAARSPEASKTAREIMDKLKENAR